MPREPHDAGRIRQALEDAIASARRDALVFSALTIFLTPVFLAGAAVGIVFALHYADLPVIDHLGFGHSVVTGINVFLLFMFFVLFFHSRRPRARADLIAVASGLALLGLIALISYGTSWSSSRPGLFWSLYGGLVVGVFAALGYAYEPKDDYYLGWWGGILGDPFTVRDDVDRGHLALGLAAALPRLIAGSYGEIFGSGWIWHGLDARELEAAADALRSLGARDADGAALAVRRLGRKSQARVVRALGKLALVSTARGSPALTGAGEKLVGVNEWH